MDVRGRGALVEAFVRACREAGARAPVADVEGAGIDLLRRWSEPARGYHDVTHLNEVLDRLTEIGEPAATAPVTRLAAWFHDAVYTGHHGDDEAASATLARHELRALGVGDDVGQRVAALVLATAHHQAHDEEAGALCDADLAILAADPDRYASYVAGVRREHAHVADDDFRAGRAAVLADLVARATLFRTAHGRGTWDAPARRNLRQELALLRGES